MNALLCHCLPLIVFSLSSLGDNTNIIMRFHTVAADRNAEGQKQGMVSVQDSLFSVSHPEYLM